MRRALVLINPNSRKGTGDVTAVLDRLRAGGLELTMASNDEAGAMQRSLREIGPASDLVIVGGGDGTVNGVIDILLDLEKPLGILPLGTANDLARTLALPVRPDAAAEVILRGRTRRIDIGQVNRKSFLNVASLGLSADMARALTSEQKARWGVLGYPISLWQVLRRRRSIRVEIDCDGRKVQARAIQISVGNGRFYGGGMAIAADAAIDDGDLDLVLMAPQTVWQLLRRVLIFRWGWHDLNATVRHLRGRTIRLTTKHPVPINTDGEITTATPAEFRLLPKALEVFVP
jgi:YegS/Rv2252/BmrU family lipid kinase